MSIRSEITILRAGALEKMKHFLSNAHYFNPTRSIEENKNRKREAKEAASGKRVKTLERALKKTHKTWTINCNFFGPVSCLYGKVSGLG